MGRLSVPAKTPKDIVDKLSPDIVAIVKEPDTARKFADQGADIVTSSPEVCEGSCNPS